MKLKRMSVLAVVDGCVGVLWMIVIYRDARRLLQPCLILDVEQRIFRQNLNEEMYR